MQRKQNGEIEWLQFDLLSDFPHLQHAVFLRHGGISTGPFASLNLGNAEGEEASNVFHNRAVAAQCLGLADFAEAMQCHGTHLAHLTQSQTAAVPNCDGFLTSRLHLGVMVKHADCQGTLLYDPINHAIAAVHCGWKGNVQNIYGTAVAAMGQHFGSRPENLLVGIGPSLGPEASEFVNAATELPTWFAEFEFRPHYYNLWEVARAQLQRAGVLPHHIEIAHIRTYSNPTDYFSYRRSKVTGRHATVSVLR